MSIDNALAGVAVRSLAPATRWYEQLLERPGKQPMPSVCEWSLPAGGALQVFEDPGRAGSSSVTLSVRNLDALIADLRQRGVAIGNQTRSPQVSTATIEDPDGNQVVLAEQHSDQLAR